MELLINLKRAEVTKNRGERIVMIIAGELGIWEKKEKIESGDYGLKL
jgi:hypothetical protein